MYCSELIKSDLSRPHLHQCYEVLCAWKCNRMHMYEWVSECVCLCVCEKGRERERANVNYTEHHLISEQDMCNMETYFNCSAQSQGMSPHWCKMKRWKLNDSQALNTNFNYEKRFDNLPNVHICTSQSHCPYTHKDDEHISNYTVLHTLKNSALAQLVVVRVNWIKHVFKSLLPFSHLLLIICSNVWQNTGTKTEI